METKKIGIACFVGGVIGTTIALMCVPAFWWLGMMAGFGAGYLCYDLREVKEMIPVAWQAAKKGSGFTLKWLLEPHPFFCLYLIFSGLCFAIFLPMRLSMPETKFEDFYPLVFLGTMLSLLAGLLLLIISAFFAAAAACKRKCFWIGLLGLSLDTNEKETLLEKGYKEIPLTYQNIYCLMLLGFADMLAAAAKEIGPGVPAILRFLFRDMWVFTAKFFWMLFKLIHSKKRMICGIDSALGTAIAYFSLGINAATPAEKILVIVCGGIVGAMTGVLNFEIVSKRILRLAPT